MMNEESTVSGVSQDQASFVSNRVWVVGGTRRPTLAEQALAPWIAPNGLDLACDAYLLHTGFPLSQANGSKIVPKATKQLENPRSSSPKSWCHLRLGALANAQVLK
jgi:hypothetical protein